MQILDVALLMRVLVIVFYEWAAVSPFVKIEFYYNKYTFFF